MLEKLKTIIIDYWLDSEICEEYPEFHIRSLIGKFSWGIHISYKYNKKVIVEI